MPEVNSLPIFEDSVNPMDLAEAQLQQELRSMLMLIRKRICKLISAFYNSSSLIHGLPIFKNCIGASIQLKAAQ
jgi:hypothetical protein